MENSKIQKLKHFCIRKHRLITGIKLFSYLVKNDHRGAALFVLKNKTSPFQKRDRNKLWFLFYIKEK